MQRHDSFINLDIHAKDEGRCLVQVGLDGFTPAERSWLFRLFESVKEGREVGFAVDSNEKGEQVLKFVLAPITEPVQ